MHPQTPIEKLPKIGVFYSKKLKRLEIITLEDLIYHFPFRYEDFSQISASIEAQEGQKVSIQGVLWQIKTLRTRHGKFLTTATIADQSGTVEVIWFNQPYLTKTLKPGMQISLSGKVTKEGSRIKLLSPSYEIIKPDKQLAINNQQTLHTGRIVPIYPETEGVSSKWLRARIAELLPLYIKSNDDFLPQGIIENQKLIDINLALSKIHFPENIQDI